MTLPLSAAAQCTTLLLKSLCIACRMTLLRMSLQLCASVFWKGGSASVSTLILCQRLNGNDFYFDKAIHLSNFVAQVQACHCINILQYTKANTVSQRELTVTIITWRFHILWFESWKQLSRNIRVSAKHTSVCWTVLCTQAHSLDQKRTSRNTFSTKQYALFWSEWPSNCSAPV
jgi:hypothetical protein